MNATQNMNIAKTIAQQLGGNKLVAMTGAKFTAIDNGLQVRVPMQTRNKSNIMQIVLTPADTYTVKFLWLRAGKTTERSTHEDIYWDSLIPLFEDKTGLRASL